MKKLNSAIFLNVSSSRRRGSILNLFCLLLFIVLLLGLGALSAEKISFPAVYEQADFNLNFTPRYPLLMGEETSVRVGVKYPSRAVTVVFPSGEKFSLSLADFYWRAKIPVPNSLKSGWNRLKIFIRSEEISEDLPNENAGFWQRMVGFFNPGRSPQKQIKKEKLIAKTVWIKAYKKDDHPSLSEVMESFSPPSASQQLKEPKEKTSLSLQEVLEGGEGEMIKKLTENISSIEAAKETATQESLSTLKVKGNKTLTFTSRNLEGSREGYVPSLIREETLRLNLSGMVSDTYVDANLFSTSTIGSSLVSEREDKVSVLLRRASTEAFLGDFTAQIDEVEFAKIDKVLQGVRLKGDYGKWGFMALTSTPRGESKTIRLYGDGTQGPYNLGFSPVVVNSERVYVDNQLQKRGDDYDIDYQAGTVTFKNRIIISISVIRIDFDQRQTIYNHATYGGRLYVKPTEYLRVGATYLNDSDTLNGASETRSSMNASNAIDPKSHYVLGLDAVYTGENIQLETEGAYSFRDLNLLSSTSTKETGKAAKIKLATNLGPVGLTGYWKKVNAFFYPISDAYSKQSVLAYGGSAGLHINDVSINYQKDRDSYTQNQVNYKIENEIGKIKYEPNNRPSLSYFYDKLDESNDPVLTTPINRTTTKNFVESKYAARYFNTLLRGGREKRLSTLPTLETTIYDTINLGFATAGFSNLIFASNWEIKKTSISTAESYYTRTTDIKTSLNLGPMFSLGANLNYVNDEKDGDTSVLDLSYGLKPIEKFDTKGSYRMTSVLETFGATPETVSKQAGSFSLELSPVAPLRLRYYFKPNFTKVMRTDTLSYNNETSQFETMWAAAQNLLLGATFQNTNTFSIDNNDYQFLSRKQSTSQQGNSIYTIKFAPLNFLSAEFNYILEKGFATSLASIEPLSYLKNNNAANKFEARIKTSLTEKFALDSSYNYSKNISGTGEAIADALDTDSHSASFKGIWTLSDAWTVNASCGLSRVTNNLLTSDKDTYAVSPGAGFIYKFGNILRVDGDILYSRAYTGVLNRNWKYSLKAKYEMSQFVNLTLRWEYENNALPYYKTTEVVGNVEINL